MKKKIMYLEILRIICCLIVIFGHTGTSGNFLFATYKWGSFNFWIHLFISIFIYFVIPTFFAVSGAVLIDSKNSDSIKHLWKKRILKTLLILILFSFLYYLHEIHLGNQVFNLSNFFTRLYSSEWNISFWFLYMYLGYLVCFPILNIIAKNLKTKHFCYILGLSIFFQGVIPILEYLIWQGNYKLNLTFNNIWFASNTIICPCIGYFIKDRVDHDTIKKYLPILWIVNIVTIIICCLMTYYKIILTGECSEAASQTFHNCFSLINCATIFSTIKYFFGNKNFSNITQKILTTIGECTFGIYLIHIFIMKEIPFFQKIYFSLQNLFKPVPILAAILYCILVFIVCLIIVYLFKQLVIFLKKNIKKIS